MAPTVKARNSRVAALARHAKQVFKMFKRWELTGACVFAILKSVKDNYRKTVRIKASLIRKGLLLFTAFCAAAKVWAQNDVTPPGDPIGIFAASGTKSVSVNFSGAGANGAPTNLDPANIAGVWPQTYWNNADGNSGDLPNDVGSLVDSDNTDATITFHWEASASWGSGTGTDSGNRKMLNGYLDPQNGNAATIVFGNVPEGNYRIIVYAVNRPAAFNDADYSVTGAASSPVIHIRAQNSDEYNTAPGFVRGTSTDENSRGVANYVQFDDISPDASGQITVTAQSFQEPGETPPGTAPVNGVQIVFNPPAQGTPPEITSKPQSTNVTAGTTVKFKVVATGTPPLTYEWRKNNVKISDGGHVSGAATDTLTITGTAAADEGKYSVAVSNAAGSVTSPTAVLSLYNGSIRDRMVSHWTFDEKTGLVAKNSITAGKSGDLLGYPDDNSEWIEGKIGGALSFDGVSQYVVVPDYPKATTAISVSAWVQSAGANPDATIAANTGVATAEGPRLSQFELGLSGTDGDLRGTTTANNNAYTVREGADKPLPTGDWHYVTMTADGAMLKLYRDGELVNSVDYSGNINEATAPCIGIGAILDNTPDPNDPTKVLCHNLDAAGPGLWAGLIDDLAIWTRTLGADEVQAIYQAGLAGKDVSTVGGGEVTEPKLTIIRTGTSITISWDQAGFKLQSSDKVDTGYADVAGVTGTSFTINNPTGNKFYRLTQ
jgi:hypothetical protein